MTDIRGFFATKLLAYQPTSICWENLPFNEKPSYLAFFFTQSDVRPTEHGARGKDERTGFVQITVYEPRDDGVRAALLKAEEIEAVFHRGLSGSKNGISIEVEKTVIGPAVGARFHYGIPVTIYWRALTEPVGT